MAVVEISRIQVRRGQENQTGIPTLAGGEFGWAADTEHLYIGLRRDDGGARDANVRVLTENDLFQVVTTVDLDYTYRNGTTTTAVTGWPNGFIRPIANKADDTVSIKDFGVYGDRGSSENVADSFQIAINNLFLDPQTTKQFGAYTRPVVLHLPAGEYNIDRAILLPRHTTIVGDGIDKTIINLTSTASHAFQTIDLQGNTFNPSLINISSGGLQPDYIHIEGLTIQYATSTNVAQCLSLLSLDCTHQALIKDVRFQGNHTVGDTANGTYSGINIRGYSSQFLDGTGSTSENVMIDHCIFDSLYHGVLSNFSILYPTIQNSTFNKTVRGVTFNDPTNDIAFAGPRYGKILNNTFTLVEEQGIYCGSSPEYNLSNHISMNNIFRDVGNGGVSDAELGGTTSIITFFTDSNISSNDFFSRQEYTNRYITNNRRIAPLIQGRATLDQLNVKSAGLSSSPTLFTSIARFPITAYGQQIVMKYALGSGDFDILKTIPNPAWTSTNGLPPDIPNPNFGRRSGLNRIGTLKYDFSNGNWADNYTSGGGAGSYTEDNYNFQWNFYVNQGNEYYDIQGKWQWLGTGEVGASISYQITLVMS